MKWFVLIWLVAWPQLDGVRTFHGMAHVSYQSAETDVAGDVEIWYERGRPWVARVFGPFHSEAAMLRGTGDSVWCTFPDADFTVLGKQTHSFLRLMTGMDIHLEGDGTLDSLRTCGQDSVSWPCYFRYLEAGQKVEGLMRDAEVNDPVKWPPWPDKPLIDLY